MEVRTAAKAVKAVIGCLVATLIFSATGCREGAYKQQSAPIIPAAPVTLACALSPASIYPGDPVTVTGTLSNADLALFRSVHWTVSGGAAVSGSGMTAMIATNHLPPGTFEVKGTPIQTHGDTRVQSCGASFTVKPYDPPTVSCSASPSVVNPGGSVTVTSVAMSPQNRPLTYSYAASTGSVSGTTSTATLSTAGVAPNASITISCLVTDDKGKSAESQTSVRTSIPPSPPRFPHPVTSGLAPEPECVANPAKTRATTPIHATVVNIAKSDRVQWLFSGGEQRRVHVSDTQAWIDTGQLPSGTYKLSATIQGKIGPPRGCSATFVIDPKATLAAPKMITQSGALLYSGDVETGGFAMYSYVLAKSDPQDKDDVLRLHNMVQAVIALDPPENHDEPSFEFNRDTGAHHPFPTGAANHLIPKERLGVTYVPITVPYPSSFDQAHKDCAAIASTDNATDAETKWIADCHHYDVAAANSLLQHLACTDCAVRVQGKGPFLVTTLVPLGGIGSAYSVIVQDMSQVTPDSTGDWLSKYNELAADPRNWAPPTLQTLLAALAAFFDQGGRALAVAGAAFSGLASLLKGKYTVCKSACTKDGSTSRILKLGLRLFVCIACILRAGGRVKPRTISNPSLAPRQTICETKLRQCLILPGFCTLRSASLPSAPIRRRCAPLRPTGGTYCW